MITLVLGGARSGKSAVAEQLATRLPAPMTYVATTNVATTNVATMAHDADMAARIAAHQARRPASWRTVETDVRSTLLILLTSVAGTVLVDSVGAWVSQVPDFEVDIAGLCDALVCRGGDTVLVSDEVGLGVHPSSEAGRRFRDVLGEVNQAVAAIADEVLLVVAGRTLRLDGPRLDGPRLDGAKLDDPSVGV